MEPQTFDTPGGLQLDVRVPAGRVEITAGSGTETRVDITGEREQEDVLVELQSIASGHRLVIDLEHHRKTWGWRHGNEYRVLVKVPQGSDVAVSTGSADLTCEGALGAIELRSGSGDLSFDRALGDVRAKVASGDLRGDRIEGDLTFSSASGDAEVGRVAGSVIGRTASGDVAVDVVGGAVQVSGASGDVQIGSVSAGDVTIRSVSGDVTIGVARGTKVWLDLGATSGDAVSELDAPGDGTQTDPVLELHVTTVSGDILVRRAREDRATA